MRALRCLLIKLPKRKAARHVPADRPRRTSGPFLIPCRNLSDAVSVEVVTLGQDRVPGVPVMSSIPLDLERRCEQRWVARFSAARALREQHRLERQQQQQQLTASDNSKRKPAALRRRA
jgi:hypothetical protein